MSQQPLNFNQIATAEKPNFYELDRNFDNNLRHLILEDDETFEMYKTMLTEMGEICGAKIAKAAPLNDEVGAKLEKKTVQGKEVNVVRLPKGAEEAHKILIEMGAMSVSVSDAYRNEESMRMPYVMEMALGYLIAQADPSVYLLPMLTSGVAATIERFGSEELRQKYLPRFCTLDPKQAYLGAMVLTEPWAGSDVGAVRTTAKAVNDTTWKISGTKTFITTPQADIHLVLARPEGAPAGTKGIGLFLVPVQNDDGSWNNVTIPKLEHKMGINASATAEVVYEDAIGYNIGDPSSGFKYMLTLMNISRLKVGIQALGIMRRSFLEAAKYAAVREQFNIPINSFPLVREMLCDIAVDVEACFALLFRNAYALDQNYKIMEEGGDPKNPWAKISRGLTPLSKNRASAYAVKNASLCIQVHGGYGYIKEFEAERLLRDAQIITLYEGTNEIQVMDALRAISKEEIVPAMREDVQSLVSSVSHKYLTPLKTTLLNQWGEFEASIDHIQKHTDSANFGNLVARRIADWVSDLYSGAILLKEAQEQIEKGDARKAVVAKRFFDKYLNQYTHRGIIQEDMIPLTFYDAIVNFAPVSVDRL